MALEKIYKAKVDCDIVLIAGEERFPVHSFILNCRLPYFEVMFTSSFHEKDMKEVEKKTKKKQKQNKKKKINKNK